MTEISDKLQHIREKCIAANPAIVELKFGCQVELRDEDFTRTTYIGGVGKCTKHKKSSTCNEDCNIESALWLAVVEDDPKELYEPKEWTIEKSSTDLYEILGRPIRLADVLLALGETDWHIGQHGRFFKWSRSLEEMIGQPVSWTLRVDDLEKQSEETINFLYELLNDRPLHHKSECGAIF